MPLIRYRSSDVTKLIEEPCPCGLFAHRIAKIRARCDEMVVCGMGNVGPWVFEELLRGIEGISSDWQVGVRNERTRDVIELRLELTDGLGQKDIEQLVRENLNERFSDFSKNLEMKLYHLRVVAHRMGSLRGTARKLNRVIDERRMLKTVSFGSASDQRLRDPAAWTKADDRDANPSVSASGKLFL
jgi:phenylacetate-CoA ligase